MRGATRGQGSRRKTSDIKYISIKGLKIPPQCTVCRKESKKQKILQSSGTREGDQLIVYFIITYRFITGSLYYQRMLFQPERKGFAGI